VPQLWTLGDCAFLIPTVASIAFICTGRYFASFTSESHGISIGDTQLRIKSTRAWEFGALSIRPRKDTRGSPRASHNRSSQPFGNWTSLVGSMPGYARDAVATSWGRCACKIVGWEDRETNTAAKYGADDWLEVVAWAEPWISVSRDPSTKFWGLIVEWIWPGLLFCEVVSILLVMVFKPTAMKEEIFGGVKLAGLGSASFSSLLFRFLILFPLDRVMWLERYFPIGESKLWAVSLKIASDEVKSPRSNFYLMSSSSMVSWSWVDISGHWIDVNGESSWYIVFVGFCSMVLSARADS